MEYENPIKQFERLDKELGTNMKEQYLESLRPQNKDPYFSLMLNDLNKKGDSVGIKTYLEQVKRTGII